MPALLFLRQVCCEFACHADTALLVDGIVNGIPQRGDLTVDTAEGALVRRGRVYLSHCPPDVGVLSREVQDGGLIVVIAGVIKVSLAHLQHHWGAWVGEAEHFTLPIYLFEVTARLRIAPAGKHAAVFLLVLFPQQLQQSLPKITVLVHGVHQGHGFIRKHLALVQKRPKLLWIGDLGRQETDIRVERQVDEAGEGKGSGVVFLLDLEQAVQPHPVILTQHGQPEGQQVQLQQIHVPADHGAGDTGIADSGYFVFAPAAIIDSGPLERVSEFRLGTGHGQHCGGLIALGAAAADLHLEDLLIQGSSLLFLSPGYSHLGNSAMKSGSSII